MLSPPVKNTNAGGTNRVKKNKTRWAGAFAALALRASLRGFVRRPLLHYARAKLLSIMKKCMNNRRRTRRGKEAARESEPRSERQILYSGASAFAIRAAGCGRCANGKKGRAVIDIKREGRHGRLIHPKKGAASETPTDFDFADGFCASCMDRRCRVRPGTPAKGAADLPANRAGPADGQGGFKTPGKEALAGEGSFVTVTKSVYLEAHARGAASERVDYEDPGKASSESDVSYVIRIEPDPTFTAAELCATIRLSDSQGMSVTLEGVWRRLPGYSGDLLEYANSGKHNEMLNRQMD